MTCPKCNAIVSTKDTECPLCHTNLCGSDIEQTILIPPEPVPEPVPAPIPKQKKKSKSKLPIIIAVAIIAVAAVIAIPKNSTDKSVSQSANATTKETTTSQITTNNIGVSDSFSKLVEPDGYIDGGKKMVSPSVGLNLRYGPSEKYDFIALLPYGTQVEIVGIGGYEGWVYVYCESLKINGWVAERYLVSVSSSNIDQTSVSYFTQSYKAKVTPPVGLNLRSGPGEQHQKITLLKQGTTVTVLARSLNNYDWLYVCVENGNYDYYGFVHSDYIS